MQIVKAAFVLFLMAVGAPLLAHPGHETTFLSGFAHPIFGWDHLLIMTAVGIWAVRFGGWSLLLFPSAFIGSMSLGFGFAAQFGQGTNLELIAGASAFLAVALLFVRAKPPVVAAATLVALSGTVHGWVHGAELGWTSMSSFAGIFVATAFLHGAGILFGLLVRKPVAVEARVHAETRRR